MAAALPLLTSIRIDVPPDFDAWRPLARQAVMEDLPPSSIDFSDITVSTPGEIFPSQSTLGSGLIARPRPHTPRSFLDRARIVAAHRDADRWNLLYRILYRLQTEPNLLRIEVDADVNAFLRMLRQVQHDLHKMHAFVRFRRVDDEAGEHFIAWYRPEHRILTLAAPFFQERFTIMRWSILTPDASVAWDPETKQLHFSAGAGKESAPPDDELEELWKTYYGNIFNPARLNASQMRGHMPVKYWEQLPEVEILPTLMATASKRVEQMVQVQISKPSAAPFVPEQHTLTAIRSALPSCKGCDLYQCATQVVPGVGHNTLGLMLVGEQPGDQEDLQGRPFVGPAGEVLHRALAELNVDAKDIFVTNAVKHFKFVERGKRRLHQSPRMSEITACRPWLLAEIDAVKPRLILCLGATAAKSLLGGTFALMRDRGKILSTPYAEHVMATLHPSAVLRAPDHAARELLYRHLRDDIGSALRFLHKAA